MKRCLAWIAVWSGLSCAACGLASTGPTTPSATSRIGSTNQSSLTPVDAVLSLTARSWISLGGRGAYIPLANDSSGGLHFDFPFAPGSMNYLYESSPIKVMAGQMTASMNVTGNAPAFSFATESFNTCGGQADVRLFFMSHSDGSGEFDRWWSHDVTFPLAVGSTTLTVPITPDQWSSVNGKFGTDPQAAAGWQSALTDVTQIGMTFGGGCFFGHGVFLDSGSARFTLTHFEVSP